MKNILPDMARFTDIPVPSNICQIVLQNEIEAWTTGRRMGNMNLMVQNRPNTGAEK